jgi:menaquinone-dependent protoporphyrinogen oxidase
MMNRILVAYATRYGSTAEVAQAIGERLRQRGEAVDVYPVEEVTDVSGYRAVVVGSAIRIGQWLPAAVQFVEKHREALRAVPTAFFTVHLMALDDSEASQQHRAAYLAPVHAIVTPQHEAFFAGKVDLRQLNLGERLMTRAVRSPVGDLRDWEAIHAWADQLFQTQEALL